MKRPPVWLLFLVLLAGIALVGCTEEEEAPTLTPAATATLTATPRPTVAPTAEATATPEAAATPEATPTGTVDQPPEPQAMLSGRHKLDEPGVVVTDAGEEIRVSLTDEGSLWRFKPDDRWTVSRADGSVILSGTIVDEALQWEQVTGFVRLDDGRVVAYNLDIDGNWRVYPAEEMCRLAGYYARRDSGSEVLRGFVAVATICVEQLGITEGIQEIP